MTRFVPPMFLIPEAEIAAREALDQTAALDYLWLLRSAKNLIQSIPRRPSDPRRAREAQPNYRLNPMPLPQTVVIAKDVAASQRRDALAYLHLGWPLPALYYDREDFEASLHGRTL